jgi:signal transduction histidine kinase
MSSKTPLFASRGRTAEPLRALQYCRARWADARVCPSPNHFGRTLALAGFLALCLVARPCLAGASEPHHAHSAVSWFTNYGNYMPRIHCLLTADGKPDWFWIVTLIVGTALVILGYLRIYAFWLKCYFAEQADNRNKKLWQLANVFLLCAITGYLLSITMFFWPGYRLMALSLAVLVPATVAFLWNLKPFEVTFAAVRLLRERDAAQAELSERNRAMRMVFDNVAQGFITVGLDGVMDRERSAIVETWFGTPAPGATLPGYLESIAPEYASRLDVELEQLRDDLLPVEVMLAQLPTGFSAAERTFNVAYTPILENGKVQRLLVIVNDVTEHLARERMENEQRELVGLFKRISTDRSGVEEFLTEAAGLVAAVRSEDDPVAQKRLLHTLKGNCALYGLESYALLAHQVEAELDKQDGLTAGQRAQLVAGWKEAMQHIGLLLGGLRRTQIEIERSELEAVAEQARAGTPGQDLAPTISQWLHEPVERRLARLTDHARALARRLGKPEPRIVLRGNGVRLDPDRWTAYWAAMVHVIRNAVDHGIESPQTRLLCNKPEAGTLEVSASRADDSVTIRVSDDGAGVNWSAVREKAAAVGLPHRTHEDLIEALFADGLSTRDNANAISGRGVGLAALRRVVADLGGTIEVRSEAGAGASFDFQFREPGEIVRMRSLPRAAYDSLLPNLA